LRKSISFLLVKRVTFLISMIVSVTLLDSMRLILGVGILAYASYSDVKTRRAANILWIILMAAGLIFLLIQYVLFGFENIWYLVFVPLLIGLFYALFQMRLIFGGADAKALMSLAVLAPFQPLIGKFPLLGFSFMPFPWTIFSNAVIMFLFVPLSLLLINLIRRNLKFPYLFLGYKMPVTKAREKFVWPLEKLVNGKRKFTYIQTHFDTEDEWESFEQQGINEVWVTPKVPFMIPLLAGYLVSFLVGDLLSALMNGLF
jgi:preflagellin peptidase FlaK